MVYPILVKRNTLDFRTLVAGICNRRYVHLWSEAA